MHENFVVDDFIDFFSRFFQNSRGLFTFCHFKPSEH